MSPKAQREDVHTSTCQGKSLLLFRDGFLTTSVEGPSQHPPCAERGRLYRLGQAQGASSPQMRLAQSPGWPSLQSLGSPSSQAAPQAPQKPRAGGCAGRSGRSQLGTRLGCWEQCQTQIQDSWWHLPHRTAPWNLWHVCPATLSDDRLLQPCHSWRAC